MFKRRQIGFQALAMAMMLVLASSTRAQVPPPPLKPLDQSREDVGPLSASLREMQTELRQPTDFQHVYRVPGRDDLLMRMDGGLIAVFPRSTYTRRGRAGASATLPPGTVFLIGPPVPGAPRSQDWDPFAEPKGGPRPFELTNEYDLRVDARQDDHVMPEVIGTEWSMRPGLPNQASPTRARQQMDTPIAVSASTVANNPAYRAKRVAELLQQATGAQADSNDDSVDAKP